MALTVRLRCDLKFHSAETHSLAPVIRVGEEPALLSLTAQGSHVADSPGIPYEGNIVWEGRIALADAILRHNDDCECQLILAAD